MADLSSGFNEWFNVDTLSICGDVFSIASFVISVFVLWNVRTLRSTYRLRVRGPSLIRELAKAISRITDYLNEYTDSRAQIRFDLAVVAVKLKSLERKLNRERRRAVKRTRVLIDRCEVKAQNEDEVRAVHFEVLKLIEELKEHQKDLDWEI